MERELPGVELSEFVAIFCKSPDGSRRSANKVHAIRPCVEGEQQAVVRNPLRKRGILLLVPR